MSYLPSHPRRLSPAGILTALALAFIGITPTQAAVLTYDGTSNLGWFETNAWTDASPASATWTSGDSAVFDATPSGIVAFSGTTAASGIALTSGVSASITLGDRGDSGTINMSGGDISFASYWRIDVNRDVKFQGDYTVKSPSIGALAFNSAKSAAYVGTATVEGGQLWFTHATQLGSASNLVVDGGDLVIRQGDLSFGSLELKSGTSIIGRNNSDTNASATMSSFSGTGGTLTVDSRDDATTVTRGFTVDQSTDTTFSGTIDGVGAHTSDDSWLQFTKSGSGALTLDGDVDLQRVTTVDGGHLYINSTGTDASFTDVEVGATDAILIDGGSLGGTGTINITGADNVSLGAGGALTAGLAATAGKTTFQLDGGKLDLTLATASANTGWLHFDLGSDATAGTDFDQISLLGGSLDIGSDLNFSDFDLTTLSGFGAGDYMLFQTPGAISGSFGTAMGTINGLDATLSIFGNNLMLTVVPEPSSLALLGGAFLFALACRRA